MANQRLWAAFDDLVIVRSGCVTILIILLILISAIGAITQSPRDLEIEDLLKKLNKQPIKTLQSPNGEIIDCVDIYKQPAFDHPLLKNHTIKMRPNFDPRMDNRSNCSSKYAEPIWRYNESCPEGTIPIRRVRKSDLLRAESLESFGTVHPNPYTAGTGRIEIVGAVMYNEYPLYYGVRGDLSVWKPSVERLEATTSSITVTTHSMNSIHCIQVGWTVMPHMFGDDEPRIFVSWTSKEGNNVRGCYNLFCSGFIQISPTFVLGSTSTFSRIGRTLEMLQLQIFKRGYHTWWVKINGEEVGYYPIEIFPNFDIATSVDWRGEVLNMMNLGHHTITEMGSGQFANGGYGRAAHFENMEYAYNNNRFKPATNPLIAMPFPRCYNAILHQLPRQTSGPSLFFGGPGGMHCDQ